MSSKPKVLGKGLDALFADNSSIGEGTSNLQQLIKVYLIKPNRYQPRQHFEDDDMRELINSVREKGILQPLVVRPDESGGYELIAGERRWRAAKTLNLEEVPVVVHPCDDKEALEIAIIENIQRQNLNAIEESLGYKRLMEEFSYTQEQLAQVIGKSRSHIANTLRLLNLPESIQHLVINGKISAGHARALLSHPNPESLVDKILTEGLNVRAVEQSVREGQGGKLILENETALQEQELSKSLTESIGHQTLVKITPRGGHVQIKFRSFEEMDEILQILRQVSHQKDQSVL